MLIHGVKPYLTLTRHGLPGGFQPVLKTLAHLVEFTGASGILRPIRFLGRVHPQVKKLLVIPLRPMDVFQGSANDAPRGGNAVPAGDRRVLIQERLLQTPLQRGA